MGRETGGRRARGVERRLAEHQELSVVLGRALLFSMSQLEFTYSVMVDGLVTTQKKTGYKLAMWWLARKTEAMSLEKVGTPKLERRGEGGGGLKTTRKLISGRLGGVGCPLSAKTRIGYLPRSKLPPPAPRAPQWMRLHDSLARGYTTVKASLTGHLSATHAPISVASSVTPSISRQESIGLHRG